MTKPPTMAQDELRDNILKVFGAHLITGEWDVEPEKVADQIISLLATAIADAEREARIDQWNLAFRLVNDQMIGEWEREEHRLRTQAAKPE